MRKTFATIIITLVFGFITLPFHARAQIATNSQVQIEELLRRISELNAQINALAAAPQPNVECTFTRSLTIGSRGEDVKCLQKYLRSEGYFTHPADTGYFGAITKTAVAAWQTANDVSPASGFFGSISKGKYRALVFGIGFPIPAALDIVQSDNKLTVGRNIIGLYNGGGCGNLVRIFKEQGNDWKEVLRPGSLHEPIYLDGNYTVGGWCDVPALPNQFTRALEFSLPLTIYEKIGDRTLTSSSGISYTVPEYRTTVATGKFRFDIQVFSSVAPGADSRIVSGTITFSN